MIDVRIPLLALTKRVRRHTRGWKRSNCVIFAASIWWWRWLHGQSNNYLVWRISWVRWGFFHCLHGKMGRDTGLQHVVSYKPPGPVKRKFAPIFAGHVVRGDVKPKRTKPCCMPVE